MTTGPTVAGHLPAGVTVQFHDVVAICTSLGSTGGHELVVLSLERWSGWTDIRFARIDHQGTHRLTRRVPPASSWQVACDGEELVVLDAVGRGDRAFSNGEVRIAGHIADGSKLHLSVVLIEGQPALDVDIEV